MIIYAVCSGMSYPGEGMNYQEPNSLYVNLDLLSCLRWKRKENQLSDSEAWESSEGAE